MSEAAEPLPDLYGPDLYGPDLYEPDLYEPDLYESDEHAWIEQQVAALASGRLDRLDRAHLIEYLTDMTISDRRELKSRLRVLLLHLLKTRFQPERLSQSWVSTILEQQSAVRDIVEGVPSLGRQAEALAQACYPDAVRRAARETGLPATHFPATSPWTVVEALLFDPPEPPRTGSPRTGSPRTGSPRTGSPRTGSPRTGSRVR